MIVYEFKVKGRPYQYQAIDEAIRTGQFIEKFDHIGGVGDSGMGSYHGVASFNTFSHHKSVLKKLFSLNSIGAMHLTKKR
jgi:hypothetical protein